MFDLVPVLIFPLSELFHGVADLFRLGRGEHVVRVNHAFRFDEYGVGLFAERHEVAFLELEAVEQLWNHYLAALPHSANLFSCRGVAGHMLQII